MQDLVELPVAELVERALQSSFDSDETVGNDSSWRAWEAVAALHKRGDQETLEAAKRLTESDEPWRRARGADILGQIGLEGKVFVDERFEALAKALSVEKDSRVLPSLINAIRLLHDPRSLSSVLPFARHEAPSVRRAVAMALDASWGPVAVSSLVELLSDPSAAVRDWAAFAFRIAKVDSPEIRAALGQRLSDDDPTVRSEAICALAYRGDLRCVERLRADLARDEVWNDCHVEAARTLLAASDDDERSATELVAALEMAFR